MTFFENFRSAVSFTIHNIKARFFHTFLSVLGIVIGVASLVMVLALIEGMEASVRKQILQTTSMNMVIVSSESFKKSDGIRMRKTDLAVLTPIVFDSLKSSLSIPHTGQLVASYGAEVKIDTSKLVGAQVNFSTAMILRTDSLLAGRVLSEDDIRSKKNLAVINRFLAEQVVKDSAAIPGLIGKTMYLGSQTYTVIGIMAAHETTAETVLPISLMDSAKLNEYPPIGLFETPAIENVIPMQEHIRNYLHTHPVSSEDTLIVASNKSRVDQMAKGFLVFRIVMGFIVGISVLVGGIGVMNVLLISVTQRTMEIGVRKATGAKRRDILIQFLSESVVVSFLGSVLGMIAGYLGAMLLAVIISSMAATPFQASITLNTLLIVSGIAVIVGITFGTYPAALASKLNPAEAIRHEG